MPDFTARELADRVSGRLEGDPDRRVTGVAPVEAAGPGDLTFVVDRRRARAAESSEPAVVLLPEGLSVTGDLTVVRVDRPRRAFAELVVLFRPEEERRAPGVAPTAVVDEGARIGENVSLGPHAVVEEGAEVGRGTRIGAHTVVGGGARIGEDCEIGDSCSIRGSVRMGDRVRVLPGARLGTEGYGYAEEDDDGATVHVPQVGRCVIGNDVEVGANTTIDRGALQDTVVGARTKIDNLVHVGHNVRIGEDCMIVAQVGIAGSAEVGHRARLAGQAGIAGHLDVGDGARIAAQAGVIGDVPDGATYSGYPARPHREALRASAALFRLPGLLRRIRELERRLGAGEPEDPTHGGEESEA